MKIEIEELAKRYGSKYVFRNLNWTIYKNCCNVITGPNGSGKSTLLRLIGSLEKPTRGRVVLNANGLRQTSLNITSLTGFASPDLNLYQHLTPFENLIFFNSLCGDINNRSCIIALLEKLGLGEVCNEPVKTFSSGMKQRLKIAFALLKKPEILILDEPSTNLDQQGREIVYKIIAEQASKGIVVVATNEPGEVELFGQNKYEFPPDFTGNT